MGADQQTLHDFKEAIRKEIPKFKVGAKDQSWLMKVCGFLAKPFNDKFMTRFTTTMGNTVYFPTEDWFESKPDRSLRILAHEYVHLYDYKKHWWFQVTYIFPQVLALLPAIVFMVLAWPWSWLVLVPAAAYLLTCLIALVSRPVSLAFLAMSLVGFGVGAWFLVGWKLLVLLGGLLFCIPWPAPWRTKWEGYAMNVAFAVWWGYWSEKMRDGTVRIFTGPDYFFMCWSGSKIRSALDQAAENTKAGTLEKQEPYAMVRDFLYQRRLLRP
jgi:hypothetical protein